MLTFLTALDMTAELGSSADLDCLHDAPLRPVDVAGVGKTPRLTMAAEDVRYFQLRPEHAPPPLASVHHRCKPLNAREAAGPCRPPNRAARRTVPPAEPCRPPNRPGRRRG